MTPNKEMQKSAKSPTDVAPEGFTDEERAAMRERAQELKAGARRRPGAKKADGEADVLAKIAEMPGGLSIISRVRASAHSAWLIGSQLSVAIPEMGKALCSGHR